MHRLDIDSLLFIKAIMITRVVYRSARKRVAQAIDGICMLALLCCLKDDSNSKLYFKSFHTALIRTCDDRL